MRSKIAILMTVFLLANCGGEASQPAAPTALSLNPIGNKTVTIGGQALNFTISAIDPDGLQFSFTTDGSVGSGPNPYTETGGLATFNNDTGEFNWDVSNVATGVYTVEFSVMNTNADTDSETIQITVQAEPGQFQIGETLYNQDCARCHGPEGRFGSQTAIQCIDSVTYNEKVNGGSMSGYASGWSSSQKDAVLFYLNQVDANRC